MSVRIEEIPIPRMPPHPCWRVCAFVQINTPPQPDRSEALEALESWSKTNKNDHKKIMFAMLNTAQQPYRNLNEKQVKKNDDKPLGDLYEFRAHTGIARLLFFYDQLRRSIICTNAYEKKGDQGASFRKCYNMKKLYVQDFPQ